MRSISAAEEAVLSATGGRASRFRVKVKDSGGTFRDLSTYPGQNMCLEASWREDVDSPGMEADIVLKREVVDLSLAPLKSASPLNRAFAYPGSYAALLALAREVQIEVANVAEGVAPASGDWVLAFHGYIDEIDPGQGEHITLRCSDLQAKLRDTWIERERAYAFAQGANATKGCQYWRASEAVALNVRGLPTEARKNGHYYRVTTAGTTGASEPAWPTGGGATVADGTAVWTESGATSESTGTAIETVIQQILDDNVGGITLNVPSSPSFTLLPWKQDRMSVWDAIRKLVDLTGWDLRYKWDSASSTFKLTLSTPDRTKTVPDRTFTASQRFSLSRMPVQIQWVRNAIFIVFSDSADRDPQGNPKRKTVTRTDSTSITAYGRRFCEVAEDGAVGLNTTAQANALADAMLSDLANPVAEHECEVPFFRHVELGDLIRWKADGVHYDSDQDLAVTQYAHRFTSGNRPMARTSIQTRGKPSAGMRRWHGRFGLDLHALDLDNTQTLAISTSDVVGGTKVTVSGNANKNALPTQREVHVSDTSGFTPSSSTLISAGAATDVVAPNLIAGKTYYGRVIPYGHNASKIVRSQPSTEFSFVAGRASAGHVKDGIALGNYPLNGGFETRLDTGGLPDHWTLGVGVYNTNVIVKEDANGVSGNRYLRIVGSTLSLQSAAIPIVNESAESNRYSQLYRISLWVKNAAGNTGGALEVYTSGYDYAGNVTAAAGTFVVDATTKLGHWQKVDGFFYNTGSGGSNDTRSMRISLEASGSFTMDVDLIELQCLGTRWYEIGDTTKYTEAYESIPNFANSWVNYGAGQVTAAFRKDQFGWVHLKGMVKSGTVGATMFTLPASMRPDSSNNLSFAALTDNAGTKTLGWLEVQSGGAVVLQSGGNTFVSLNQVKFMSGM